MNETTKKLTDEQADALIEQAIGRNWQKWHGTETLRRVVRHVSDSLSSASAPEPVALTDGKWDGAEEWMPLAWELCANECGEDACTELVWEGSPIPEPWGDRWLEYEDQAKEMISMVRKHVPALAASQPAPVEAQAVAVPEGWKLVPVEPTEDMWGELARDVVMWLYMEGTPHYGSKLHKHLRALGHTVPEWLYREIPDADRTPPKGTVAAVIYKAMLAAAPTPSKGEVHE